MARVHPGLLVFIGCLWTLAALSRADGEASLERGVGGDLAMLEESERPVMTPVEREELTRVQKIAKRVLAKIVDEQVNKVKKALGAKVGAVQVMCQDKEAACAQLAAKAASDGNGCSDAMRAKCKKSCGACPPKGYEPSKSQYAKISKIGMEADDAFDQEFNKRIFNEQNEERVREATFARAIADRTKQMASSAAKEVALASSKVEEWKKKAAEQGTFAEANLATQALKALAVSKQNYHKLAARAKESSQKASKKSVDTVHLKVAVLLQGCQGEAPRCPHGEVYWGEIAAMRKAAAEINGDIGAEAMQGVDEVKLPKKYQIKLVEEMFADMEELLRVAHKLSQDNTVLAVIAPGSSLFTTAVVPIFRLYSKPVIAWGAHAPHLSSMDLYPNFWRMTHTTASPVSAITDILKHYNWDRVGVIMNLDASLDSAYKQFQSQLAGTNIQITATALDISTSAHDCNEQGIAAKLRYMAATKPRAVIFWPYYSTGETASARGCLDKVVSAAETAGLFNDEVSWLLTDDQFFNIEVSSQQKLAGALMLRMFMPKAVEHWKTKIMQGVCLEGQKEAWAVGQGQKTSGRCCRSGSEKAGKSKCKTTGHRSVFAYDAVYAASHAVAKAIKGGAATPESVMRSMGQLTFAGLSDIVSFDENGDRQIAYEIFNLRDQATAQKYAVVGSYKPSQFEGQRLMIPDEKMIIMHHQPESTKAGVCWVGGAHPYLYQKCKTCDRRTQQSGVRGQRNSCMSCEAGSALYPVEPGSKFGQCRSFSAPFTCTEKQLLTDADLGPRKCLLRNKCRQCRGQCTGFGKGEHAATFDSQVANGISAPNFCPPFWESYGSALNYHTYQDCVPKVPNLETPEAPRTCSKTTTTWEQHLFPREGEAPPLEDNSTPKLAQSRPQLSTLGMFYVTPNTRQQYSHSELGESDEITHVRSIDDSTNEVQPSEPEIPSEDAADETEDSTKAEVPAKAEQVKMTPAALAAPAPSDTIIGMSACQCHKRIDCNRGACNSEKTCTCAETCYLTTGNNAFPKCQGGILRAGVSVEQIQAALGGNLQGGDYCCFVACKVGADAPVFMRNLAKANAFCKSTLTTL